MKDISVKITLIYFLFGLIWILVSDQLFYHFFDSKSYLFIQSFKGVLFVIVSSLLLWILLKKNEKKFKKISSEFDECFLNNPVPMAVYDVSTFKFVRVNKALEIISLFKENELISLGVLNLFADENKEKAKNRTAQVDNSKSSSGIWKLKDKNNNERYVTLITTPALGFGDNCRLAIAIDSTEMIKSKELIEQKEKQLSLIQNLGSHGVRKHLVNILALGSLIGILTEEEIEEEKILSKISHSTILLDKEIKSLILEASKH